MYIFNKPVSHIMIGLFLSLYLPAAVSSQSSQFSQATLRKLGERQSVIQNEIDELKSHSWAGRYLYGSSVSYFRLTVAPESGFAFSSGGCVGFELRNRSSD